MTIRDRLLFFWDCFTVSRARRWQVTYKDGATTRQISAVEAGSLSKVFGGVILRATPEEGTQA